MCKQPLGIQAEVEAGKPPRRAWKAPGNGTQATRKLNKDAGCNTVTDSHALFEMGSI
jgi:hypothetical protein